MSTAIALRGLLTFVEHAFFIVLGFVFMVVGLALGVTLIMLPVGIVVGLVGFSMVVAGLFARLDAK